MDESLRNFDLTSFKKAAERIVAKNDDAFADGWFSRATHNRVKQKYTIEDVKRITQTGSLIQKIQMSQSMYETNGIYKRILLHYANLYKYVGILIPNPSFGKNLSDKNIQKRYNNALSFLDLASLQNLCFNFALKILRDGCYFGIVLEATKSSLVVLDLPSIYCRSNYKDVYGNDVIEFDVSYFDTFITTSSKAKALKAYPKIFSKAYKKYKKLGKDYQWFEVPTSIGICFCAPGDSLAPMFLNVILRSLDYEEAIETEKERELEEIRKIIVQTVPHLNDGSLLFEPDEAAAIHEATAEMLKNNKNVSVLTSYTDVDAIVSKTTADNSKDNLSSMADLPNIEAGTSRELFSPTTSTGIPNALKGQMALMAPIVQKFSNFFTSIINSVFGNNTITFKYNILPVTYFNEKEYTELALNLANSGYSFSLPAAALGFSPRDLASLKDLEINGLELDEKLVPLQTSYTQSAKESTNSEDEGGRPQKEIEDKKEQTVQIQDAGTGGPTNE